MRNRVIQTAEVPVQGASSPNISEKIFDNSLAAMPIRSYLTVQPQWETAPFLQSVSDVMPRPSRSARNVLFGMAMSSQSRSIGAMYYFASQKNGSCVIVDQKYGFLPVLLGKDKRLVAIYEIIEEIETVLDFNELRSRFPTLSFTQLTSVLGFLRSLAQFNSQGVDIDALQDEEIEDNQYFQDEIKRAVEDEEVVRVLAPL